MKLDVTDLWTRRVQFTAEIDCDESASGSMKLGLAVLWAVKNDVDLRGANLRGADLRGADLRGAILESAYLRGARLDRARLDGACLDGAILDGAILESADLRGADLRGARLESADLRGARLDRARLDRARFHRARLDGAYLDGASGMNDYVKCIQIDTYPITYTAEIIQIGCQRHTHQEWSEFSDAQIRAMDGAKALAWWKKHKDWLFQTIALCPATPTGFAAEKAS